MSFDLNMVEIVLYIHILAAASWVGGAMLLFILGVFIKDKEAITVVYKYIGPTYGYFQTAVLVILLATGTYLYMQYHFQELWKGSNELLSQHLYTKIYLVGLAVIATIIHMYISFKALNRERTQKEKIISRGTSLGIFLLNLFILYYAMSIRTML